MHTMVILNPGDQQLRLKYKEVRHELTSNLRNSELSYHSGALVSEPNPLRPLRDLQYGLGEMVFGGCRHLEYMNIWCFNEPK